LLTFHVIVTVTLETQVMPGILLFSFVQDEVHALCQKCKLLMHLSK